MAPSRSQTYAAPKAASFVRPCAEILRRTTVQPLASSSSSSTSVASPSASATAAAVRQRAPLAASPVRPYSAQRRSASASASHCSAAAARSSRTVACSLRSRPSRSDSFTTHAPSSVCSARNVCVSAGMAASSALRCGYCAAGLRSDTLKEAASGPSQNGAAAQPGSQLARATKNHLGRAMRQSRRLDTCQRGSAPPAATSGGSLTVQGKRPARSPPRTCSKYRPAARLAASPQRSHRAGSPASTPGAGGHTAGTLSQHAQASLASVYAMPRAGLRARARRSEQLSAGAPTASHSE